jgi:hypothetical protein
LADAIRRAIMVRRNITSTTTHIVARKPSLLGRALSVLLLAMSFLVTLFGIATAIYLEWSVDVASPSSVGEPPVAIAPGPIVAPREPHDPLAADATVAR